MQLNAAAARIAAIVGSLGLASILNLNAILTWLFHSLQLPESALSALLTMPAPIKGTAVAGLIGYAIYTTVQASTHNPDGTPAAQPYKPEN